MSRALRPIVLGHNAFFGVDHLSSRRGTQRAVQFSDPGNIAAVLRHAAACGAGGMMMSTHERAQGLCQLIREDRALRDGLAIYPLLPYAQKYISRANEMGMLDMVLDALSDTTLADKVKIVWSAARAGLMKDPFGALSALIRLEMKVFAGLQVGAVFLHDILTDLCLALRLKDVVEFYHREIESQCRARPAFATKNLPLLLSLFAEWGMPAPAVLTHVNKAGFNMNPSREACESAMAQCPGEIMAMGTLASGFLKPDEAYAYLGGLKGIASVVVGASSPAHVEETFAAIRRHCSFAAASAETR